MVINTPVNNSCGVARGLKSRRSEGLKTVTNKTSTLFQKNLLYTNIFGLHLIPINRDEVVFNCYYFYNVKVFMKNFENF